MPYLAPWLLKGFIESSSQHRVDCIDLDVRYRKCVWTGEAFDSLPAHLLSEGQLGQVSIIKAWGPVAYAAMREQRIYAEDCRKLLGDANAILSWSEQVESGISRALGAREQLLPDAYESWPALLKGWEPGVLSRFLSRELRAIDLTGYGAIGFSCSYLEQLPVCLLLAQLIRSLGWNGKLIIGGSGFTHILHEANKDLSFWTDLDYGIPYEGELTLLSVLDGLESGDFTFLSENVVYTNDRKHILYKNNIRARPAVHAAPDFEGLEDAYPTPEVIYPLLTSKGCYWGKCAFCTHHEGYGQGYSPGRNDVIRKSIVDIAARGGRCFYFVDEALPATKIRFFAKLFDELKLQGKLTAPTWMAECRVERYTTDLDFLKMLYNSGCRLLINGMETGSPRVMGLMKKGVELARAREYLSLCRSAGLQTGWMFFIGFPGETAQEAIDTVQLIRDCKDDLDFTTVGTFSVERGSPLWNDPSSYGIREILGIDDPYRVSFDYVDASGNLRTRSDLKETLGLILKSYPDVADRFSAIVDRSCGLFFTKDAFLSGSEQRAQV